MSESFEIAGLTFEPGDYLQLTGTGKSVNYVGVFADKVERILPTYFTTQGGASFSPSNLQREFEYGWFTIRKLPDFFVQKVAFHTAESADIMIMALRYGMNRGQYVGTYRAYIDLSYKANEMIDDMERVNRQTGCLELAQLCKDVLAIGAEALDIYFLGALE